MIPEVDTILLGLADRLRLVRVDAGLSQAALAQRSGVSLASLRRFERTGQIALASLVKLALALRREADLDALFQPPPLQSLDELEAAPPPARVRRRVR